jgi:TolA-binding protein
MQTDSKNCRQWRVTVRNTAYSLVLIAACAGTVQAQMYRWVDGNGRVHYSDTLPQTYQKSGAAEMNKQGMVVRRTQSEAERMAEIARQAEQLKIERQQAEQARLDRALMATYTTEAEIDLARDRALEHHKLAIRGAETRAKAVDANLDELRARISAIEKSGRPVSPDLQSQLAQTRKESLELKRTILNNEDAMLQVREKYEADKLRFRQLSSATR